MITKVEAKKIASEAHVALEAVAAKYGLTVDYRGGSFDSETFRPKFEFKSADADRAAFERNAWREGLEPSDFGREIVFRGDRFRIVGINTRATRAAVVADNLDDGKRYRLNSFAVRQALGR